MTWIRPWDSANLGLCFSLFIFSHTGIFSLAKLQKYKSNLKKCSHSDANPWSDRGKRVWIRNTRVFPWTTRAAAGRSTLPFPLSIISRYGRIAARYKASLAPWACVFVVVIVASCVPAQQPNTPPPSS